MRRVNADVVSMVASETESEAITMKTDNNLKLKFRPNQSVRSTNLFSRHKKQQLRPHHPQQQQARHTKPNGFVIGILTLGFVIVLVTSCYFLFYMNDSVSKRYGIVIDGGSTGSRIHVFEYEFDNGGPVFDFGGKNGLNSMRVSPGLSSFVEDVDGAGESVMELLAFAKRRIPDEKWGETEVRLMATAGLRMLDLNMQERILDACRTVLRRSGFVFRDDWASVISGSDEGVYAWIVANYALGTLGGDPCETTGIIELGGASAQVTFFSNESIPLDYSQAVKFGNVSYSLYSHSLLEFGQNVAFDLVRGSNVVKVSNVGRYKHNLVTENIAPSSLVEEKERFSTLRARGNFSACRSAALTLLQKGKEACAYDQCYIGSTFIPKLQGNFLATENFFHTSKFFGLSPKTFLSELTAAGEHFCEEDWSTLKSKHPKLNDEDLHRYCFSSAYIVAFLHDSLGIALDDTRIGCANQVNNIPLDWAYGAFIFQITGDVNIKRSYPVNSTLDADASILSGGVFAIFLLFTVYYVSKWRKPNVKTIFDLEKGKYIFTRVSRHS
ncbi:putative apyrase [Helianthus annuus]|nr:putative apyrase [Helianthus annuus]